MSDPYDRMLAALDAGTLDPAAFSHRDHVGVTVAALKQDDFYDALARIACGLQRLAGNAGVPEKFNATVTFAFVSLIAQRMEDGGGSVEDFLEGNPDLLSGNPLAGLYPEGQADTPLAKRVPVLPGVQG
ncbi:hypothetical protein [Antarcticimicrobium luteum]|uniref:Uncharacterized protein n=1 Tax=Antarcticimicrobium luteum TaxID=2547397 RepID=A0A4R5VFE1_9RHOB|nr:hypothetical protein [Antarcticimicrobium luteum]TDK51086.1 hypothetical protein E1832_04480 [Antarcticimicrobium luteum]